MVFVGIWDKKTIFKVLAWISAVLQIIMLAGSRSMTGAIGVVGAVLVWIIFLLRDIRKNKWFLCGIGAVLVLGVIGVVCVPGVLSRFTDTTISDCSYRVQSMKSTEDSLHITLDDGKSLTFQWQSGADIYTFDVLDDAGEKCEQTGKLSDTVRLTDAAYSDITWQSESKNFSQGETSTKMDLLRLTIDGNYWEFVMYDQTLWYINRNGKLDSLREVDSLGFEGHYDLATNRGYIWSRTLPLLRNSLLLGVGRDNFVYSFPNDDYVGKVNCGFDGQIVTKPHNMYLQIAVEDGIPACLILIVLYVLLGIRTFRGCFVKGKLTTRQLVGIAIFCGLTGYMVAGLANDSSICVAPVFWTLFGLGYAVN
jgi:hypothetical protein